MTVDQRRVEELERQIEAMRTEISELGKRFAVLETLLKAVSDDVKEARSERQRIAAEIFGYGIQLTRYTGEITQLKDAVAELKPAVGSLQSDRAAAVAVGRAAGGAWQVVKGVIWALVGMATAIGTFVAGFLANRNP